LGEIDMAGKYYEDWVEGDEFVTPTRTMTETDLVMFAALTGDYNELHTSEVFMKESQFCKRIGHGLLGLAISHGLLFRTGFLEGTVLAFLDMESWKFSAPFFIGDTLHVKFKVQEAKASKSKPDRGIVKLYLELMNQDDKVIQSGHKTLMIKRRPSDP
jgi:acyl dehydratase